MQEPALFVRAGDHIVPAPAEDIELARSYAGFADKGPVHNGYRLTILSSAPRIASARRCVWYIVL